MRDLRHTARLLARTPGYTLLVSVLLSLGIGASTTAFSFFKAVLLTPLQVHHPEELVRIVRRLPRVGAISNFPEAYLEALLEHASTLALTFGETGQYNRFAMTAPTPAENISVLAVTATCFVALGVQPLHGRVLTADDEERRSETPPALLSYRLWRRRFAGDPDVVGRTTVAANGRRFVVVGVMPKDFNGITSDTGSDMWIPLNAYKALVPSDGRRITLELGGRLKSGFSRVQAETECRGIWQSTMKDYYRNVEHLSGEEAAQLVAQGVELESLERGVSVLRDSFDGVLKTLIASTLLLLLIVCLNVGGIIMVRTAARQHELAVRVALGASPLMLLRQVLAEGFLLAVLGGTGGVLLALALIPFGRQVMPQIRDRSGALLPLTLAVGIDRQVVFFVVVVTLLAILCFSLSSAVVIYRSRLYSVLRSARSANTMKGHEFLIMLQVAVCTFLLLTAGLFVRTLQELRRVDVGFETNHIVTFTGDLSSRGVDASAFLTALLERVREIPGVLSASLSTTAVMRGRGVLWTVAPAGDPMTTANVLSTSGNTVSADYFETMGMRIVRGRAFVVRADTKAGQGESMQTVVNQAFVMKFFPNVDPIGKFFGTPVKGVGGAQYRITGVVNDTKFRSLREPIQPIFYALGIPLDLFVLNVRASMRPEPIIEPVRKALVSIDPTLPFREIHTMSEEVENNIGSERLTAVLAFGVGACAAVFVGAGIYGSLAYIATQRRREIAIRMALGAGIIHMARLIAKRTLAMVTVGVILGLAAAIVAASGIRSMLFNTSPQDVASIASAIVFVAVVASAATAVPVMRAINRDPAEALHLEH
jgi:putative ABC transport system permease protein